MIRKCKQAGGEGVFVDLLSDGDARVRYYASVFLQQRLRSARPEVYRRWRLLQAMCWCE